MASSQLISPTTVLQTCRDPSLLLAREECSAPRVAGSSPTTWFSNLNHLVERWGEAAEAMPFRGSSSRTVIGCSLGWG